MSQAKTWLLIADASYARLYSMYKAHILIDPNPQSLELMGEYFHENSRKKGSELISDKMGEFGSGTFVEATSPKHHEAEAFALELVGILDQARNQEEVRDIILVAPPTFMGLLNKHMPSACQKLVIQTIEKDYTKQQGHELMKNLTSHF